MRKLLTNSLLLLALLSQSVHADQIHQVAVRTISGIEAGIQQWGPTLEYLNKVIPGHQFELVAYPKLQPQLDDARQAKFQFLLTNPATYVEINKTAGARALLTLINKRHNTAQTRFGSVIFIRADRDDIVSLKDLKNKHLIAVSPLGFGGWRVAWHELLVNDFNPYDDLAKLSFAGGNQPAAVKAVLDATADAGVVRTDMLERLHDKGKINLAEFRILHNRNTEGFPFFHSTPLYPEWPFAVMPGVNEALTQQVKTALLKLDQHHPAAQSGSYIGWTEALDYQAVDDLLKELQVGPYKKADETTFNFQLLYPIGLLILLFVIYFSLKGSSTKKAS